VANALGLVLVTALILLVGIGESVALAILLTFVEAAGLLAIVLIGLPAWGGASFLEMPHGTTGLSGAAALIFFAYLGFDEIGNFAEEMRRPEKDLPRALFVSMAGATLIYLLVALSATAAVGWQELSASTAPLALVAGRALGPAAETAMAVIALAATANTVLLLLVAASRSVYGMAAGGVLPRRLGDVGGRGLPVRATLAVAGVTAMLVLLGDLARVAAFTDAAVLSSFMLVNLSLPWVACRGAADPRRRGRRALDLVLPALALVMCGWLLVHAGWPSLVATAGLAALGLGLGRWRPARGADASPPASGAEAIGSG
jgi:APA family basic amino acid/polyamine antiporter